MTAPTPQIIPMIKNFIDDQSLPQDPASVQSRLRDLARIVQATQNTTENTITPLARSAEALNRNIGDGSDLAQILTVWNNDALPSLRNDLSNLGSDFNTRTSTVETSVSQIGMSVADIQNQFTQYGDA